MKNSEEKARKAMGDAGMSIILVGMPICLKHIKHTKYCVIVLATFWA